MMLFLFSSCLIFIKSFLSLFVNLFEVLTILKLLLLSSNFILIYYIYTYPKRQRKKLSGLRAIKYKFPKQYKLNSTWDHLKNILVLTIYPSIFILGILWLRFKNTTRYVDLLYYYYEIQKHINVTSSIEIILNILVISSIFIIYIIVIRHLSKYVKFALMKRHIFLSQYQFYSLTIIPFLSKYIDLNQIFYYINFKVSTIFYYLKIKKISLEKEDAQWFKYISEEIRLESKIVCNKTLVEEIITTTIYNLTYYIHHIVLFLVILYDLKYNNLILEHMFTILPYIFIYEILVRMCKFLQGLNIAADDMLYHFLYSPIITIDEDTYQIGHYPVAAEDLYKLFKEYVYTDLNYNYNKEVLNKKQNIIIIKIKNICIRIQKKLVEIFINPIK